MTDVLAVSDSALADCAAEPIRIPGGIQPHGALVVLDPDSLAVRQASANAEAFTGLALSEGVALTEFAEAAALVAEVRRWQSAPDAALLRTAKVGERLFQLIGHRTHQGLVLEFEEPPRSEAETLEALYPRLRVFLARVAEAPDITAIAQAATDEVRTLTGFNRTLLYSFEPLQGDGTVLAEAGDGVLPSLRGQRFPGSDIPAQARELYRLNRIRLIPTADYAPAPIVPPMSPVDGQPLDMSQATLRSVSPIHLEYMRNMGTGSSMSISILVEGALWGLISGHSLEPHGVNAQVRTACDMLGQILSLQIEARIQAARTGERLRLKEIETELLGRLAVAPSFQDGLEANADLWTALTAAAGAAVVSNGTVRASGLTPSDDEIRAIAERLASRARDDVAVIESMAEDWPEAEAFAARASGVIAVSISQIHPDYVMWFRPEVVRAIDWSGDPAKPMSLGLDRLHPRKSFELWKELVRLRALPWSDAQVDSARSFRGAIQDIVLQRAEERAAMTERLESMNKELESFSYSISHDLRAPFRHIAGYAELLGEYADGLDDRARHYLRNISGAAIAAGRLVDDLLNFSHLGRASLNLGRIDMAKLVAEVRHTLEPEVAGRPVDWRIGALPDAWGDGAMVRQVLQNLIQNAVKYTAPRDPAVIEVTGEDLGEAVAYTVRDNGVGFDMAYAGKLFGVFQRLHRTEDFEGTGIGLALVKRIVERHGGTVEPWGAVNAGAVFTFTLPKRKASPPAGETTRG